MKDYRFLYNVGVREKKKPSNLLHKFNKFLVISIIFSFILTSMAIFSSTFVNSSMKNSAMKEVLVAQGDTIWSIAKAYHQSDYDIRELIYHIKKVNKLTTAQIYPGQTLYIPHLD